MDLPTFGTFIGGALMIGSPAGWILRHWQISRQWTLVEGVVMRMEPWKSEAESDGVYNPVIRVRRPDGETVQFKSHLGAVPSPWRVGDTVTVRVRGVVVQHDSPGASFFGCGSLFALGVFVVVKLHEG